MSEIIRCYLDAKQPLYEQFEQYLVQRYQGQQIDIRFEQELSLDASRLLTFLVTLPDIKRGEETSYQRRIFLSFLPIAIPSVIYFGYVQRENEPISEFALEQVRQWLARGQDGRRFKRELERYGVLHSGPDVPLINGNMREE